MFKKPFSFDGRIRRLEYGLTYLIFLITYIPLFVFINQEGESFITAVVIALVILFLFCFLIAQGTKRCHDRGISGWWQLIPFYHLWMLFGDGEKGDNQFGTNPKGR